MFKISIKEISYVNDIFFNLYESIVYCILNIDHNFDEIPDENFENILNEIEVFTHILMKINIELRLTLKQILYLLDIIQVKEAFTKNGIPVKENLKIYFNILRQENSTYLIPDYIEMSENEYLIPIEKKSNHEPLNEEFLFLEETLSSQNNYSDLILKLLNNKMRISKDEQYRIKLLNILCSNNLFIYKSKFIFETILRKYKMTPINKTKENISQNESKNNLFNIGRNNNEEKENDKMMQENNEYEETDETDEEYSEEYDESDESDESDDEDDDGTGVRFLNELKKEKKNKIIVFLNRNSNICLDEVLLSLFEGKFSKYFELKKSKENLILNQSFDIFVNCVLNIEKEKCKITKNNKLAILYCLSYIKFYCYHLSKIIHEEDNEDYDIDEILEFLNKPSEFRKVIKIYILKILNLLLIGNYKHFLEFIDDKELFTNDFDFTEKVPCLFNYLFLQNDSFDEYKQIRKEYMMNKMENFKSSEGMIKLLNKNNNNKYNFFDLMINEEISNLTTSFNDNYYRKLSNFTVNIIKDLDMPLISKNTFAIFTDYNSIINQLPSIQNLKPNDYEILLYAYKFAFICSNSKENSFYSNIFSPNLLNIIKNVYIPGNEPNDDLLVESGDEIQKYIQSGGRDAIYMCSCNVWYRVGECGLPMETHACENCKQLLGGRNHVPVDRPGHVRIYIDEQQRQATNLRRSKLLRDLMVEVEQSRNLQIKGFKKVKRRFFVNKNKKVRNISNITYRILSFTFYSCILFIKMLGYIENNELENFYYSDIEKENGNKSLLFIISDIWRLIIEELSKRDIENIQCFLNMIMPEIYHVITENTKEMNTPKERNDFEQLCNGIIENAILNYKNYYDIYIRNNQQILEIKDETIKSILQETSDINNLPSEIYPLINYFNAANYPSNEMFYNQFMSIPNPIEQYPVITNYLNACQNEENIKFLENFHLINPFVTYMLEKYNNKISRKDAKEKKIKDELNNDNKMKRLFDRFKVGWKNIYKRLSNYDCHGQLTPKKITEKECLAYVLNDNLEDNYGKYIATAYKDFITYQNEFLKPLIKNNNNYEYLYPYSSQINKEIIVQRANKNEIVSLDIQNDLFNSFKDLIYTYSYRNFVNENGNINFLNYKDNKFDFYSIEVELSKILLPEKRLFFNEQRQDFITYAFEGFNQNENVILDFQEKLKKMGHLSNEEKANISNMTERIDYKLILFNLQSLFLYFNNKRNITGEEELDDEIEQLPAKIIKLDDDFIHSFRNLQCHLKLNQLIDCYEYVEFLNYDKIIKNISENAKVKLNEEQLKGLKKHFSKDDLLISKKELGQAVRKFVSRYLTSDRFKNFEWNIFALLKLKKELWSENVAADENEVQFDEEIEELEVLNINIGQSLHFYEKLGGERAEVKPNVESKSKSIKKNLKKKGRKFPDY
jgi:hypothetical protein